MKRIKILTLARWTLLLLPACNNQPFDRLEEPASIAAALTSVSEFPPLPTLNAAPSGITRAHDGSLWFTEKTANKVARLTATGVLTEYAVLTPNSAPELITSGGDGNIWFTERYGRKIGRISDTGGAIAEFALTGSGEFPTAITTDQMGKVWFASNQQPGTARIGWINSMGVIGHLATAATRTTISGIAPGPDGNLWVSQLSTQWGDSIAKVTTAGLGSFTNYRLSNPSSNPQGIVPGSDGNLWFTEGATNKIGRIMTAGRITEFSVPTAASQPFGIAIGSDGNIWFTEKSGDKIGRITPAGVITEYAVPTPSSQPFGIIAGPGGNLYFTEQGGNKIGKVG